MIDRNKKAVLHIAKNQVIPGDQVRKDAYYRQMLLDITGKSSSADPRFTDIDFYRVMEMFTRLGFGKKTHLSRVKGHEKGYLMTDKQYYKIKHLEAELGWLDNPKRLIGFSKRTTGKHWKDLAVKEAHALISGMLRLQKYEASHGTENQKTQRIQD